MSKHTPAPWEINPKATRNVRQGNITIANCSSSQDGSREEEEIANAKLIAAAPELLEALERALHDFRKMTWTEETYIVIESAIKKATL